MLNFLVIGNNL